MPQELKGKNIAILVTNGFEQVEMTKPRQAFIDAGANTYVISPAGEQVQGWNHFDKADYFQVDIPLDKVNPLENAGATWIDKAKVLDGNLLSSRHPDDLPAFIDAAIKLFARKEAKL